MQDSNGTFLTNDSDKAEEMNNYFANIGIKLVESFIMTLVPQLASHQQLLALCLILWIR